MHSRISSRSSSSRRILSSGISRIRSRISVVIRSRRSSIRSSRSRCCSGSGRVSGSGSGRSRSSISSCSVSCGHIISTGRAIISSPSRCVISIRGVIGNVSHIRSSSVTTCISIKCGMYICSINSIRISIVLIIFMYVFVNDQYLPKSYSCR